MSGINVENIPELLRNAKSTDDIDEVSFFITRNNEDINKVSGQRISVNFINYVPIDLMEHCVKLKYSSYDSLNKFGESALFYSDSLERTLHLISKGCDPLIKDKAGRTVIFTSDADTCSYLIDTYGLDASHVANTGKNALFNCYDINKARYLISKGANPFQFDNKERNVIHPYNHTKLTPVFKMFYEEYQIEYDDLDFDKYHEKIRDYLINQF